MDQYPIDLYQLLQLSRRATTEEIRLAFLSRARELHPDLSSATGDIDEFKLVRHAYEVLIDPVLRAAYDHNLSGPHQIARPRQHATVRTTSAAAAATANDAGDAHASFCRGHAAATVTSNVHHYWRHAGPINRRLDVAAVTVLVVVIVLAKLLLDVSSVQSGPGARVARAERAPAHAAQSPLRAGLARSQQVVAAPRPPAARTDRSVAAELDEDHGRPVSTAGTLAPPAERVLLAHTGTSSVFEQSYDFSPSSPQFVGVPSSATTIGDARDVFNTPMDEQARRELREFYEKTLPELLTAIPNEPLFADVSDWHQHQVTHQPGPIAPRIGSTIFGASEVSPQGTHEHRGWQLIGGGGVANQVTADELLKSESGFDDMLPGPASPPPRGYLGSRGPLIPPPRSGLTTLLPDHLVEPVPSPHTSSTVVDMAAPSVAAPATRVQSWPSPLPESHSRTSRAPTAPHNLVDQILSDGGQNVPVSGVDLWQPVRDLAVPIPAPAAASTGGVAKPASIWTAPMSVSPPAPARATSANDSRAPTIWPFDPPPSGPTPHAATKPPRPPLPPDHFPGTN